ncbi:hypothetical protein DFJ74DRAFT_662796 [Hyaloraphidium curvatum]|nr:hypothetical protein DFJ74DRAFT_662796 [Hyaloraphidium curvatum]
MLSRPLPEDDDALICLSGEAFGQDKLVGTFRAGAVRRLADEYLSEKWENLASLVEELGSPGPEVEGTFRKDARRRLRKEEASLRAANVSEAFHRGPGHFDELLNQLLILHAAHNGFFGVPIPWLTLEEHQAAHRGAKLAEGVPGVPPPPGSITLHMPDGSSKILTPPKNAVLVHADMRHGKVFGAVWANGRTEVLAAMGPVETSEDLIGMIKLAVQGQKFMAVTPQEDGTTAVSET